MANVLLFGDVAAASQTAWECYRRFNDDRHKPDDKYRQFQESIEEARLDLQKLQLGLLAEATHAHFGFVSDDFQLVWQTLTDSPASSPSCTYDPEVEDPFAPFAWPEDVDCTTSSNCCSCDHYRDEHGYVDRHALPFSFHSGRFHRPGLGIGTTCSNTINIPTTSLDMITKMDGNKGGTALWPTSATNMTTCPNCLDLDDDDGIDNRHV